MPYANDSGLRIGGVAEGEGPRRVVVHGWAGPIGIWWQAGWVDGLPDEHGLAIHHASGRPIGAQD